MKKPRRKVYRGRRERLYWGRDKSTGERLYFLVYVTHAKQNVKIQGNLMHAMMGEPGVTIGCHLSNCAWDNKEYFPHPVVWHPSFNASTCLVPDEIRNGQPYHCVKYEHDYNELVDLNDKDQAKTYVQEHPELVEREYTLKVPRKQKAQKKDKRKSGEHHKPTDPIPERSQVIPRGALRRAINAGLLPKVLDKTILDA
jgi:hypothetical protein